MAMDNKSKMITGEMLFKEYKNNWSDFLFKDKMKTQMDNSIISVFNNYLEELESETPEIFEYLAQYCANLLENGGLVLGENNPIDEMGLEKEEELMRTLVKRCDMSKSGLKTRMSNLHNVVNIVPYVEGMSQKRFKKQQIFTEENDPLDVVHAIIRANPILNSFGMSGFDCLNENVATFVIKSREVIVKSDYTTIHYENEYERFFNYFNQTLKEEHRYEMIGSESIKTEKKAFVMRRGYFGGRLSVAMKENVSGFFEKRKELGVNIHLGDEDADIFILLGLANKMRDFKWSVKLHIDNFNDRNFSSTSVYKYTIKDLYRQMLGFYENNFLEEDKISWLKHNNISMKLEILLDSFMKNYPDDFISVISEIGVNLQYSDHMEEITEKDFSEDFKIKKFVKNLWESVIENVLLNNSEYLKENERDIPKQVSLFLREENHGALKSEDLKMNSFEELKEKITRIAVKKMEKKYEDTGMYSYFFIEKKKLYDHLLSIDENNEYYYDYSVLKSFLKINEKNEYFDLLFAGQNLIFVMKKDISAEILISAIEKEALTNRENYLLANNYRENYSLDNRLGNSLLPNILREMSLGNTLKENNSLHITKKKKI